MEASSSLVGEETEVPDDPPRPQPNSISVHLEAHLPSEVNIPGSEGLEHEESQLGLGDIDDDITLAPPAVGPEIEPGASSSGPGTEPRVEIQEILSTTSERVADGSDDCQSNIEPADSLVSVAGHPPFQVLSRADIEASTYAETPFLLDVDVRDGLTVGAERLSEGDSVAPPPPAGDALSQSVFELPCSEPGSPHGDAPSYIMQSALLVPATEPVTNEDPSPSDTVAELDAEDDWTSVDPDEPPTPRPSSPVDLHSATKEVAEAKDDLTISAVLLTQSQYISTILPPILPNDRGASSPASSTSSLSKRPRVHTSDRPDWAVAPQDERDEKALRRHSVDSPNWAVAPDLDATKKSDSSGKKGRKSDPGSGARKKKSRRAWTSR